MTISYGLINKQAQVLVSVNYATSVTRVCDDVFDRGLWFKIIIEDTALLMKNQRGVYEIKAWVNEINELTFIMIFN